MPNTTKLSVCVIVKNEEANIEECLKSVMREASEIIVSIPDQKTGLKKSRGIMVPRFFIMSGKMISV